jgi:hypothetical protein
MTIEEDTVRERRFDGLEIYSAYRRSRFLSLKHSSYFQVYEELLGKYRDSRVIFVEIGVLNGGSLFMWRDYFGPAARIIGIDVNPEAKKWEAHGFEIYLGSQSDEGFWDQFFESVGQVDVVLDDGGHTNEQQIITAVKCIPHIADGGMLIVEDTHASYQAVFGNPSKYSFISYCKSLVDAVNARFPSLEASRRLLSELVYSIGFYESIVCLRVDRSRCFVSTPTSNEGISSNAADYRNHGSGVHKLVNFLREKFPLITRSTALESVGRKTARFVYSVRSKLKSRRVRKHLR